MLLTGRTVPLEDIKYVDHPEIQIDKHESTQMPFRYVLDKEGQPILPEVSNGLASSARSTLTKC